MQSLIRNDLQVIGKKYATDKSAHRFKGLTYLQVYDLYLRDFRYNSPSVSLLEIGVKSGGSLKMWQEYFGKAARIVGIDKNPACEKNNVLLIKNIRVYTGLQDDKKFLLKVMKFEKEFNIIIDDASHEIIKTIHSFNILWSFVKSGGFYIIEDIKHLDKIFLKLISYLDKRKDMRFLHLYPQLCIIGKV